MTLNFIPLQDAAAQAGGSGAGAMNIIMIVLLIAVFWLFMIRPQQKRQKQIREFRNSLTVGSKVVTAGGIHGTIKAINDATYQIQIADGVKITVEKGSVYAPGTNQQASSETQAKAELNQ